MLGQAGAVSFVVVWQHHVGAQTARSPTENKPSQNNPAEITAWLCPWNEPSTDPGQQEVTEIEPSPWDSPNKPKQGSPCTQGAAEGCGVSAPPTKPAQEPFRSTSSLD